MSSCPRNELGDVRGHAVEDGVGGEDPAEVVGPEGEGPAVGAGDAGGGERAGQEAADSVGGDGAVLQADDPLEQQGHGRLPGTLVQVVGGGERDGPLVPRTRAMMADRASASSGSMTIL